MNNVEALCGKIQTLTERRPIRGTHTSGRYKATIFEIVSFISFLSSKDRARFFEYITGSIEPDQDEIRSTVLNTDNLNIRMKGVFPKVVDGEPVPYSGRKGFCPLVFRSFGNSTIGLREAKGFPPYGTNDFYGLSQEVITALKIGIFRTDKIIGFSIFEDLLFNGSLVGAVFYEINTAADLRLQAYLAQNPFVEAGKISYCSGKILVEMLALRLSHGGFPRLSNYRVFSEDQTRLVDLGTSCDISDASYEEKIGFAYIDISRTLVDFIRLYQSSRGLYKQMGLPSRNLIPFFLMGIFERYKNSSFYKVIVKNFPGIDVDEPPDVSKWPNPMMFASLLQPIEMSQRTPGIAVDLKDFCNSYLFRSFYESLGEVVG